MGHLTSAVFLALCSAAGNAFLARAPQLTPGSAVRKQASTNARAPLAGFLNTRQLITGSAASRIGSNGAAEMEKRRSRVSPLHDFKGVEPDIAEAGNATMPHLGGVDGVEEEKDDGSMHSASGDPDIVPGADLVTDAGIESLNKAQLPQEDSSYDVNDESRGMTSGDSAAVKDELSFQVAADGTVEKTGFGPFDSMALDDDAEDVVGSVVDGSGDNALDEDWLHNLAEDGIVNGIVIERVGHTVVGNTVAGDITPMLNDAVSEPATPETATSDSPLNDKIRSVLNDAFAVGGASEAVIPSDGVYRLVGSVLVEALARGGAYETLVLDDDMDDLMWSKLYDALYGRTASTPVNVAEFLDGLMTSVLNDAFFGPAASKAVSSLTKDAGIGGFVVEEYIRKVSHLYGKFKEARFPTVDATAADEELPLELTSDTGDGSDHSNVFNEERPVVITDDGVLDGIRIRLGAFGPVIPAYAVAIKTQLTPHDTLSDKATKKTVAFGNVVTDLVLSLAKEALAGKASAAPLLDDGVDDLMWAKLHHSTSRTGRAAAGDTHLGDALDYTLTNVLHKTFFGPVASKGIASLAKYADDRETVVEDYVGAVSKVYDTFKKARGRSPKSITDNEVPVVRKAKKEGWGWLKKLWGKGRRQGR